MHLKVGKWSKGKHFFFLVKSICTEKEKNYIEDNSTITIMYYCQFATITKVYVDIIGYMHFW